MSVTKLNNLLDELVSLSMKFRVENDIKKCKELSNKIIEVKDKINKLYLEGGKNE